MSFVAGVVTLVVNVNNNVNNNNNNLNGQNFNANKQVSVLIYFQYVNGLNNAWANGTVIKTLSTSTRKHPRVRSPASSASSGIQTHDPQAESRMF